nr:MAG: nonstructural polyprotein [Norovirus sp.]
MESSSVKVTGPLAGKLSDPESAFARLKAKFSALRHPPPPDGPPQAEVRFPPPSPPPREDPPYIPEGWEVNASPSAAPDPAPIRFSRGEIDLGIHEPHQAPGPGWNGCPVPPMVQRSVTRAKEPPIGAIIEFYEGFIFHYALYVGGGRTIGVHSPQMALSVPKITVQNLAAWWRVAFVPRNPPSREHLLALEGERWPYASVTNNCYTFCCKILDLEDDWLSRRLVTTGPFNHPNQSWNQTVPEFHQDSKLELVRDAVLSALNALVAKPVRELVNVIKPLNVLSILTNCDWTFTGIVEAAVLLAELFGILWSPPDIASFLANLTPDCVLQGPEDLAKDIVPIILGGIGLALGFTKERATKLLKSASDGLRSATSLGQYGIEIFNLIKKYLFGDSTGQTLKRVESAVIDLEVLASNNITEVVRDRQATLAYLRTLDLEEERVRELSSRSSDPHVVSSVNALLGRIATARSALAKAQSEMSNRVRPVVIMLSGPPGIGKTKLAEHIAHQLAKAIRPGGKVGLVPREAVDHWDGYKGQEVMLWDDYGMANIVGDCNKLQAIADTAPVSLNCDRIENKGMTFTSEAIVITTNAPGPAPLDHMNLGPVCRRVDFLVYCNSPEVETHRRQRPGDTQGLNQLFKKDFSHLQLQLAPQGGFDCLGNTPYGKGTMSKTSLPRLLAAATALALERLEDFQLQAPVYDFDKNRVMAFSKMANDNGLGMLSAMAVANRLKGATSLADMKEALNGMSIAPCQVVWRGITYSIESDGSELKIQKVTTPQPIVEVNYALKRLAAARAVTYWSLAANLVTTAIQAASTALVIHRAVQRIRAPSTQLESHNCRYHRAEQGNCIVDGVGVIGHKGMVDKYGLCETDEEESAKTDPLRKIKPTPKAQLESKKKGKKKVNAFSRRGLSDEEYDEYKKIREERGGNYSIQEYLEDREHYERELAERQADGDEYDDSTIRQKYFGRGKAAKAQRKKIDWEPTGPAWADDSRQVDYDEIIDFQAPPSIWSRIQKFGSGWGCWVSPTLFITASHVIPEGCSEAFGVPVNEIAVSSCGEFTQFRFPKPIRPDVTGLILEEGAPEGTVASILVKRSTGELVPLAVRMSTTTSTKVQGKVINGQTGMLLTGANAKGMDLCTLPGDCGCPYFFKRGNEWVVFGVHAAATRSGNTVICAIPNSQESVALEGGHGTYVGHPIIGPGKAPKLSTKTKFWRSSPTPLPPGTYEPAYLGGKDPRVENGPSLQQVMRDQLAQFSAPRGKLPRPELLAAAVETVTTVLEQTMDQPQPWSFQDACQSLDKTTSSGHPHFKRKNDDWNGTAFTGALGDQANHANNMYRQGKSQRPYYAAALKDELVAPRKIYEVQKKRLLWGADLSTVVRAAMAFGPFCDAIKGHVIELPIKIGMNAIEDGPVIYQKHAQYKYSFDADYSAWDSTQQREIMRHSLSIMTKLTAEPELAQVVAEDLLKPSQLDVGDFLVAVHEGLPSGFPCTSQVNSINHWILTLCALSEVTNLDPDVVQANSYFSFYGDDEIVSTDLEFDPEKLTRVLKGYGLKPTRPDKTEGPIELKKQVDGLVFLRRTISHDARGFQGRLDRESILRQLYWTRGPNHDDPSESLVPHSNRKVQLLCLLGEAALHGEKFYRRVGSMVTAEARSGGMEIFVPSFRSMFAWMRFHDLSLWEGSRDVLPDFVNEDE